MRGGGSQRWQKLFAYSRAKLLWCAIYCANLKPGAGSQSGSWSQRGLGSQALKILREYDLAKAIVIQLLIQPCACKVDSSIFSVMSRLKFSSTTRASFPSMPSTERTKIEKCFFCLWQSLPCLYFLPFFHQSRSIIIGSNL